MSMLLLLQGKNDWACKWISSTAKRKSNWNIIWSKFASVTKDRAIWGTKLRETQWTYSSLEKEKMGKFFTMAVFICFFMLPDHKLSLCPTHCVHSFHFLYSTALWSPSFLADTLFFRWKSFPFPTYILSFIFHAKTNFNIFMLAFLICTGWFLLFLSP